jgi:hypothetical protein
MWQLVRVARNVRFGSKAAMQMCRYEQQTNCCKTTLRDESKRRKRLFCLENTRLTIVFLKSPCRRFAMYMVAGDGIGPFIGRQQDPSGKFSNRHTAHVVAPAVFLDHRPASAYHKAVCRH